MKVKITYPHVEKRKRQRQDVIKGAKWLFVFSAIICAIVNFATGGPAWIAIFLWSLWMVWAFVISPDLVEYNRISFWIKLISGTSILLIIIDALFSSGLTLRVVPIISFSGLAVAGLLLFTDLDRQKQNMMPMLMFMALSLISSIGGLVLWHKESSWTLAVMGGFSFTLLIICFVVLGKDFIREIKKRFHVR